MGDPLAGKVEALCRTVGDLVSNSSATPTLVYFDIIGIAWPIRCLLHLNNVDYRLVQVSIGEWAYRDAEGGQPLKRCFPNGHVPLYVDGSTRLTQSNQIMLYLARKYGMAGQSQEQELAIMEVMAHAYDALFHWNGLLQIIIKIGISPDVVDSRLDAFMGKGVWGVASNGFRNHLNGFENYLAANPSNSGFFVGEQLSVADLHAFNILCNWYKAFDREVFVESYPTLERFVQRVGAIPKVADYIRTKQEPTTWFPMPNLAIRLTSPGELQGLLG